MKNEKIKRCFEDVAGYAYLALALSPLAFFAMAVTDVNDRENLLEKEKIEIEANYGVKMDTNNTLE